MSHTVLRDLHTTGELAARYREVPGLLAGLDDTGLRRAGAVLSRVDISDVDPALARFTVAVTGSSALQPIQAPLTAQLARHGFVPDVRLGGYRQHAMELRDPANPLFGTEPDLTVCVLDADEVFGALSTPWTVEDVAAALAEHAESVEALTGAYRRDHAGALVLTTVPLPRHWAAQIVDLRSRALLGIAWREFEARLLRLAVDHAGVFVLDLEPLVGVAGPLLDPRMAAYTKVQFSDDVLAALAREIGHVARALRGRTSKCLVLDLDGTTWGGVLAEDGPTGIVTGDGPVGEAFTAVQKAAKQLAAQGLLLAVCSKNDEDRVRAALRDNPDLTLREDDLVALVANWGAKPDNLRQIAEQLNIGVDSLVFIDDSASERGLVRATVPEVPVIAVDADEPALHLHALLADGWFTTQRVTDEDRARGERYRTERKRLEFRERTESLAEYLAQLGTTVELFRPSEAEIGRISQITQRTNQFNLTTIRLDVAAVTAALADPGREVFGVRCADRFGEHGVVGAVFLTRTEGACHIDNFLLSCRVLARGVEDAVVHALLARARESGATAVTAEYRPTAKNGAVAEFYPKNGFQPSIADAGLFTHDLLTLPPAVPHVDLRVPEATD
ncbi:HAD-IIIC family phosphatase [Actinokineospora iranica]|uniref:HAD-superfamily phosphatase, subfamily IIIC/FkbH-like domain-containing protein n=1 Tax=Actinokineospora iranica TaxID=1271860 RepID=A0A1G6Z2A4_9PSEU|nr:HAD-IIIC family phosphatase [Actinokineospora iranica]SDD96671.1 HAD-superfamily phosphatase, subfamily IIIC/FkbH-like domain-containing protein [Actinokineospora iranica]